MRALEKWQRSVCTNRKSLDWRRRGCTSRREEVGAVGEKRLTWDREDAATGREGG